MRSGINPQFVAFDMSYYDQFENKREQNMKYSFSKSQNTCSAILPQNLELCVIQLLIFS